EDCFIDGPTQRQGVHACPRGTYVRGVHVDKHRLTCCYDRERGYSELLAETVDVNPPHQEFGMHACPVPGGAGDAFLTGFGADTNKFLCAGTPAMPSAISNPVNITLNPEASRRFLNFFPATSQATWKAAVRNWLLRQFDVGIDQPYLNPVTVRDDATAITVEGGVTRRLISYPSLVDGVRIPAYLFLPPGFVASNTYRGALVMHGHFAEAKDGLGVQWNSPLHAIGLYLAQQGFVTLAPDTRAFGSFIAPGETSDGEWPFATALFTAAGNNWGTLAHQMLLDSLVNVTVLNSQAHLSSTAIGGLSLGADMAMWLAAIDPRVGDAVLGGNFTSFGCLNDFNQAHLCQTVPGVSSSLDNPMTNLLFDAGDVAGLVAPHRLYAMWGDQDSFLSAVPPGSSAPCNQTATDDAAAIYSALGQPTGFMRTTIPGMVHEFDNTTFLSFLTGVTPTDQLDYGTQCGFGGTSMHCCPPGKAMAGIHNDRNDFICRDVLPPAFETCFNDTGTQRQNMHACPAGNYMRGLHASLNLLTCCHDNRSPAVVQFHSEIVDTGTQAQGMHTCVSSQPFMTGVRIDQNRLLCDGI
ncbi:MAG TPA: hypothetical protein VJN68_06435, partial [Burkholderiaceae bacterium]|nr:hypothetical protein [Burkholderiaceae bacterium]